MDFPREPFYIRGGHAEPGMRSSSSPRLLQKPEAGSIHSFEDFAFCPSDGSLNDSESLRFFMIGDAPGFIISMQDRYIELCLLNTVYSKRKGYNLESHMEGEALRQRLRGERSMTRWDDSPELEPSNKPSQINVECDAVNCY